MTAGSKSYSPMLHAAQEYTRLGLTVVPIPARVKGPVIDGWQKLQLSEADLPKYFNGRPQNIGVRLGRNGLTDIDLDAPEAYTYTATVGGAAAGGTTRRWTVPDRIDPLVQEAQQ